MNLKVALAALCSLAFIAVFQNCGVPAPNDSRVDKALTGAGDSPGAFAAGETFTYDKSPYQSPMVEIQVSELNYLTSNSPRAIAIAKSGLGFVKVGAANQADAEKQALESCYAITRGEACALLARAGTFAANQNVIENSFGFTIPQYASPAVAEIPFVAPANRASLLADYLGRASPKAMAVSLDGTSYVAHNHPTYGLSNDAEAARLALQRCELNAMITPCFLFLQNDRVVYSATTANAEAKIRYSASTLTDPVPTMRNADFVNFMVPYLNFLSANPTASANIYVSATGAWGAAYTTTPATLNPDTKAASDCASGNPDTANQPCLRFATGRNTSLNPATALKAISRGSMALHCRTVPRLNCANHREMGCPLPAIYYTTHAGLKLESCM